MNPANQHMVLSEVATPAFIYDETTLSQLTARARDAVHSCGAALLFTMKPFSFAPALERMKAHLDGFAASSLFEARLAGEVLGGTGTVHITSPGLRANELTEVASLCDYIAFNSLPQWMRHSGEAGLSASCGLRVNPQLGG